MIKRYSALYNNEFITMNVLKGEPDDAIYVGMDDKPLRFNNAAEAEYATGGLVTPDLTVFAYTTSMIDPIKTFGFTNILAPASGRSIHFGNNRSITFYLGGYDNPFQTTYQAGSHSLTSIYWQNPYRFHGLFSDTQYNVELSNGVKYKCILAPGFRILAIGNSDTQAFRLGLLGGVPNTGVYNELSYAYPSVVAFQNTNEKYESYSEVPISEKFQNMAWFANYFWSGVVNQYACVVTATAGGAVTPTSFFANANEPRMFTVTPDQHHAIYSVKVYNTATNQEIPAQESAMDLSTGAKSYMFTMPAANVRIVAEFRSIEIVIPVTVKYTTPKGVTYTTSFNLLYDDASKRQKEET